MPASKRCWVVVLLLGGMWICSALAEEDPDHIYSSDPVLLSSNESPSADSTWLTCANKECSFSKRQMYENVFTHRRKVLYIYAKERTSRNDPIRYGDEVALFYRERNDDGAGLWLSCRSDTKQCSLDTCPGLPHFKHWMWDTESCAENKFIISGLYLSDYDESLGRSRPLKVGDKVDFIRRSGPWNSTHSLSFNDSLVSDLGDRDIELTIGGPLESDTGKLIILKDLVEKCGEVNYDLRYKVCDKCGSNLFVRPKKESWKCCAGDKPYNPQKYTCCEGSLADLSESHRDAKEARCCGVQGYFPDVQSCCLGKVHHLPGQDSDADDSTIKCCGEKPYLTTQSICCNTVVTSLISVKKADLLQCCGNQGFNAKESYCLTCGETKTVVPLSEKASWSCCQGKEVYNLDDSKCCEYGVENGDQCNCLFSNKTFLAGERFADPTDTPSVSCRNCVCQDGTTVCDTVPQCPALLPHACTFYAADGECCPIFECFDKQRDNNHKIFLRRNSHVSANAVFPNLEVLTISVWMRTDQTSAGTLLSYATDARSNELVIRSHPNFRVTFKDSTSDELSETLNDGDWHFVCIQWESWSGLWFIYIDEPTQPAQKFTLGLGNTLMGKGYLVLGRQQQPKTNLIDAEAFLGEIAYFNVWTTKIDFIDALKTDCLGLYEGNVISWSVGTTVPGTIDTHHSASIIKADVTEMCTGANAQDTDDITPGEEEFIWEADGPGLESLSGQNCAQSSVFRIRRTEHAVRLKICPSSTASTLGNLHVFVVKESSDSKLHWPFPYSLKLSVIVKPGNAAISRRIDYSSTNRRKSKRWSLVTGSCTGGDGVTDASTQELNPDSYEWADFITRRVARNNYENGKLRIKVVVYTEEYGGWVYWNGHYYSHRYKIKESTWFEAEGNCVSHGTGVHLASILDELENDFVSSRDTGDQWMGLTDNNNVEKSFNWIDGSAFGEFVQWDRNEPSQTTEHGDCGVIKADGKWSDEPCEVQDATNEGTATESTEVAAPERAYTCKTSGKHVDFKAPPVLEKKVLPENEAGIFSVDVSPRNQNTKITFVTGLHYTAPNMKFSAVAEKVRYGARFEFGTYVQMTTEQLGDLYEEPPSENLSPPPPKSDKSGTADLDGVVDMIIIDHYGDMDTIGNSFSIEFWMRPRRMPPGVGGWMALFSKSSSSSGYFGMNLKSDGQLRFTVAPTGETSPLTFNTRITAVKCKIKTMQFQHIAVTGGAGSTLTIYVNGEACFSMSPPGEWGGVTSLPASSEGALIFGSPTNPEDSTAPVKFNGQLAYIRVFGTERAKLEIGFSINNPSSESGSPVGSWHLRQSQEITLIHYVIADSNQVSSLKVLEDFTPTASSFPIVAYERNQKIYLFRLTAENDVVVNVYQLNEDRSSLQLATARHTKVNTGTKKAQKGCFTVARDTVRDSWIVITCKESKENPVEVIFTWKVFKTDTDGSLIAAEGDRARGSLRVTGIDGLDTRPSATVVDFNLLITAGTNYKARTLFLDLNLDSGGRPRVRPSRVVPYSIGPDIIHAGISYYVYLYKPPGFGGSTTRKQVFLRRLRPRGGGPSPRYKVREQKVDPTTLTARSTIGSDMPDNDWFWFLFRISNMAGGNVIQSGQRVLIETPDNNPTKRLKWNVLTCDGKNLKAYRQRHLWKFWIFKTETCDPVNIKVLRGEIGPNDCILLWPKTLQFGPNCFCTSVIAFPTEKQIQGARQTFGSWFGPWRLMLPMESTPIRPIPEPTSTGGIGAPPRTVYEGNKYAFLHYSSEGIRIFPEKGVIAALLRFARTTVTPVVVSKAGATPPIKVIFRGNGGPLPLVGAFRKGSVNIEAAFKKVYREGSFAQKRMTSGLFYSISYTLPAAIGSFGQFTDLARIAGLHSYEYPDPPQDFVWLLPPPLKVNGICQAVSTIVDFDTDTLTTTAPNSLAKLTEIAKKAVGPGSFNEGLFKPLLTVHIDVKLLHTIGERVNQAISDKIKSSLPQPPGSDSTTERDPDPRWRTVGDAEACYYMSDMSDWKDKVIRQKIEDKLHELFNSEWMKGEMVTLTSQIAPEVMRDASVKYSSYGGIAVLIANRLRGTDFLEELLIQDLPTLQLVLHSYLPVLDAIRPDLGLNARKDIISALVARSVLYQPWKLLGASENQDLALKLAFETLMGKLVPDELRHQIRDTILQLFRVLFSPMTSTQLGILERVLQIKKQSTLKVESQRAEDFQENLLKLFKDKRAQDIATLHKEKLSPNGELDTKTLPGDSIETVIDKHYQSRAVREQKLRLLMDFQNHALDRVLFTRESQLSPQPEGVVRRQLVDNPRLFSRVSFAFNTIGALGALGSIILEISDSGSALYSHNLNESLPAGIGVAATFLGALGSWKSSIDFIRSIREHITPNAPNAADAEAMPMRQLNRAADDIPVFDRLAAADFRVDLASTERVTTRLSKYFTKAATFETKLFLALGVVADFAFLGLSLYNIYQDSQAETLDGWKLADDIGLAVTSAAGATIGILAMAGVETGPAGIFVLIIGLAFIISDAARARREAQKKLHQARCDAWTDWCEWGEALFKRKDFKFLKDPDSDPCTPCPIEKRDILRDLCQRGHIPMAHRFALVKAGNADKDIKSLIAHGMKQKTCPAWLRHLYKRRGSNKQGKKQQTLASDKKSDL